MASNRDKRHRIRDEALRHYSGSDIPSCACCHEHRREFLAIDHIEGGGGEHRRQTGMYGSSFTLWLRRNGYPAGFRVLCHNCNLARGIYGRCPHDQEVAA